MAGDKKITELTELVEADSQTWREVVDLNEADPELQNKKMKDVNPLTHTQGTDQSLDTGGVNAVSAYDIALRVNRIMGLAWLYGAGEPTAAGFMTMTEAGGSAYTVKLNKATLSSIEVAALLATVNSGDLLLLTFPDGFYLGMAQSGFSVNGDVREVTLNNIDVDANFDGIAALTIIKG